jgi:tetratricopeptide (TPR) repeat protein/tRNA A-37 threonylcarbamoyl transferase component Bud32
MADLLDRLKAALSDRYLIERELGSGGMATVYLAEDVKHRRQVAVKVLRPELTASIGVDRFLREVEIAAKLAHPHVLSLHDSGNVNGFLYYVMPYVSGGSLRDRLNSERQLPVEDALKVTKEVAEALDHAHSQGIVHRDIKPENIMFEGGHAIVADFGVARAVSQAGGEKLTETGMAIGTPHYMSPEQASGDSEIDGRTDVYALGCVLHEMLAGETPFDGPTAEVIIRKHLSMEPPRITTLRPAVPEPVADALMKSLAKTPADRYATAERFTDALAIDIAAFTRRQVVRKVVRRLAVSAAAVIVAVIGAVLLVPRWGSGGFDPNRVLVVALEDESGLEEAKSLGRMAQDYIIDILTEAGFAEAVDPITTEVVSQLVAAADLAGGAGDILALADQARAGTVVSGSYYAEGDSIFVQTRITDARDGSLLRTVGPVDGSIGARSELVARLGREVVAALAPLLDQDLGSWEPAVQPAAYEAYEAYSEGLEAWVQGKPVEAGHHFERAVSADSTFNRARLWAAHAYQAAGRALGLSYYARADSLIAKLVESREQLSRYERCHLDLVTAVGPRLDLSAAYEAARCLAQQAPGSDNAKRELAFYALHSNRPGEVIEILKQVDPDRGVMKHCNCYWGFLTHAYHMLGDYEGELEVGRQALERSPENIGWEVAALAALGRVDDVAANLEARRSLPRRETLGTYLLQTANILHTHGHRDVARGVFDEAIEWYRSRPDSVQSRPELAFWLYIARQWDEAQRVYEELAEEYPENSLYLAWLGKLAVRRGDRAEALRISEELRSVERPDVGGSYTLERANLAALLGDREQAMTLLGQAIERGVNWGYGVWLLYSVDLVDSLRDYPPFQEFLRPKG